MDVTSPQLLLTPQNSNGKFLLYFPPFLERIHQPPRSHPRLCPMPSVYLHVHSQSTAARSVSSQLNQPHPSRIRKMEQLRTDDMFCCPHLMVWPQLRNQRCVAQCPARFLPRRPIHYPLQNDIRIPTLHQSQMADELLRRAQEGAMAALAAFGAPKGFDIVFECTSAKSAVQMGIFVSLVALSSHCFFF